MKISLNWLKDYVAWDDDPEILAAKLTAAGLNVEGIDSFRREFPGVVVARVLTQARHPGADRLSVCTVDDGTGDPVSVVCGAANVRAGLTVLFARVGAQLPGGLTIKKAKIRGETSKGMICSAVELNLGLESSGIMELNTDLPNGTSADVLYGFRDDILDIEVTPNRPDWLSHLGVAREVAAIYGTKISLPTCWNSKQSGDALGLQVRVEDYKDCPRYMAFGVGNITVGPSPEWMQRRLLAVGSRPINNLVDITNYVLFETGQPLHVFDREKISGSMISIGRAGAKTRVRTLDGVDREVGPETLLINDMRGGIALAGVMGLANSEISDQTKSVLLESAFFNPLLVRTASRQLGLTSEASYRFERGADWEMVEKAAQRALHLIKECAGGVIIKDWADRQDPDRKIPEPLPLRIWQVNRVLGTKINTGEAAQLLQGLGLKVQPMGNAQARNASAVNMMVKVPSFRRDLQQEIDLIEEIARSYGLDRIQRVGPFRSSGDGIRGDLATARNHARRWLVDNGFHEIVTSSFAAAEDCDRLELAPDDLRRDMLVVDNPHHGGDTLLRTSLLPSLLVVLARNFNAQTTPPLRLFQINRTYLPALKHGRQGGHPDDDLLPAEPSFLQFAVSGVKGETQGGIPAGLVEIKSVLLKLEDLLRVPLNILAADREPFFAPGLQMQVLDQQGNRVGALGVVAGMVARNFGLEQPVAVGEIVLDQLELGPRALRYQAFSRFPAIKRDLSLLVPQGVSYQQVAKTVQDSGGPLLDRVELFDVFKGKELPTGTSAYGIRLKFLSEKGNLKGKTVDRAISGILDALDSQLNIKPRI